MIKFVKNLYYSIKREIQYRKRIKELKKRDPFIYKWYNMNYVGISCGFHDAALSVIDDNGNILFAGHSERYSMKKHDSKLCSGIVEDAKNYINNDFEVHYYERPYVKAVRQFIAKQKLGPFNVNEIIGKHNLYQL